MANLSAADAITRGTAAVDAVWLGDVQVWPQGGGFLPTDWADLYHWLDPASVTHSSGSNVDTATDLSGNGNDMTGVGTYTTAGAFGHLLFAGGRLEQTAVSPSDLVASATDCTIVQYAEPTQANKYGGSHGVLFFNDNRVLADDDGGGLTWYIDIAGSGGGNRLAASLPARAVDTQNVLVAYRRGSEVGCRVNGELVSVRYDASTSVPGGSTADLRRLPRGRCGDLIWRAGPSTDADMEAVEAFIAAKYGFSL